MKRIFIALFLILGILYLKNAKYNQFPGFKTQKATIGDRTYTLYLADTEARRVEGLSGSRPLGANEGMLFIFAKKDYHGFWMKDMNYPIDIIFIDDNIVVDIILNLDPSTYPKIFTAKKPFNKAIELNTNVSSLNITLGSLIKFR